MRIVVVGAGASYAEAQHAGLAEDLRPPLMKDFARKMWRDFNPHFQLTRFLSELGYKPGTDARECFFALERMKTPSVNVERFFEYAYLHRDYVTPGYEKYLPYTEYHNLLYHGILNPLESLLVQGLFKNGVETTPMPLAQTVAPHLRPGDLVLNLNYDTIFEIGAEQAGHELTFLPNKPRRACLMVSKPHGSMNLLVSKEQQSFYFARPLFAGSIQPADGSSNYIGFVPPRLNKQYIQHPIARTIIEATKRFEPEHIIFWGVGLTDSDTDLLKLFRHWCHLAKQVDFINPSVEDVKRAKVLLGAAVNQFSDVMAWQYQYG